MMGLLGALCRRCCDDWGGWGGCWGENPGEDIVPFSLVIENVAAVVDDDNGVDGVTAVGGVDGGVAVDKDNGDAVDDDDNDDDDHGGWKLTVYTRRHSSWLGTVDAAAGLWES